MYLTPVYPLLTAALVMLCQMAAANEDPEAWQEQDDDVRTLLVNEGMLEFLRDAQDHRVLQTSNQLIVTPESLRTGWVALHQCQSNLDPVSAVTLSPSPGYRIKNARHSRESGNPVS